MEGTLSVGQIRAEYLIDRAASNASAIRDRCDEAMRKRLKQALVATLSRWCDRDDSSIWLVRCVDIDVAANAVLPSDELSRDVARAVATNLRDLLTGDGDGVDAIRFADAPALLARFLIDSANGDAWSRWYYGRFRGLRLLATSAVLRTVICEDPRVGLTALQRLSGEDLARVTAALAPTDGISVRISLARATNEAEGDQCLDACLRSWTEAASHRLASESLALFLLVHASIRGGGGNQLNEVIDALSGLRTVLDDPGARTDWLAQGSANTNALAHLDGAARQNVMAILKPAAPAAIGALDTASSYASEFGGCLLLFPILAELINELAADNTFLIDGEQAFARLRLLIISACTGSINADVAYEDPVLRFVCGVDSTGACPERAGALASLLELDASVRTQLAGALAASVPVADKRYFQSVKQGHPLAAWCSVVNGAAYELLKRFARRLPGFADSGCAYLWRNFLDMGAQLDLEPDRIVVRLARPALHLVLSLTGMNRTSYVLPFGDTRTYTLFTGD